MTVQGPVAPVEGEATLVQCWCGQQTVRVVWQPGVVAVCSDRCRSWPPLSREGKPGRPPGARS